MKSIAIITARGGSKRIPKKNIKEFCGKPIILYSIEAAINSGIFSEIMVSTDSEEIASIAKAYGAEVPFMREGETCSDYSTTADVLKEVLKNYEKEGKQFDIMCCIYPTAPFVTGEKLRKAAKLLKESEADSLLPVVQFSFPPQRAIIIIDGKVQYAAPEYKNVRSQDLRPLYHDCGQFYLCKVNAFEEHGSLITPNTIPVVMSEVEVQDIDSFTDWNLAELKFINKYCKDKN